MDIDISELQNIMNSGKSWDDNKRNDKNRNRSNFNQNRQNKSGIGSYVGAPFNFVSFTDKVYEYPQGKLTAHNDMKPELFTGEIEYELTAHTPIFVDNGKGEFHKNAYGEYSIPGSTMRGLIRSNVQILGLSSFSDDIDDYTLMYRNVAAGLQQKRYNEVLGQKTISMNDRGRRSNVSVLKNVQAGYLKNEGGQYYIYASKVEKLDSDMGKMNYYPLSERKIITRYLDDKKNYPYSFFSPGKDNILQHEFQPFKKEKSGGREKWSGTPNKNYRPYYYPVSYELKGMRDITAVGKPGVFKKSGYVISTGKMMDKKIVYIIPEINPEAEKIRIPAEDVRAFQIDYKQREAKLPDRDKNGFFNLPKNGECKPVFYIRLDGKLYFGFTPRLRLFYDYSIRTGLRGKQNPETVDYCKAIFGYSSDSKSYKSKVSFSDATAFSGAEYAGKTQLILSEPKPTSCLEYVKPKGNAPDTYNSEDFELRGVKQYWLHNSVQMHAVDEKQRKVASDLNPLASGVQFRGKIRFQNLTGDELGLLIWSVRLNENSKMNVGKGKPYGYGVISVDILNVQVLDMEKAYTRALLDMRPFKEVDADWAIQIYKDTIREFLKGKDIEDLPHIREFFMMKDSEAIPSNETIRYMNLREFKNQMRRGAEKVLPSVKEVYGVKKGNR